MPKERKQTKTSTSRKPAEDRRPQLMKDLDVKQWANVPADVLEFWTADLWPNALRIHALLIRQSWGYNRPDAVKGPARTKYGQPYFPPLHQVHIAELLEMEESHVSRAIAQLEKWEALKIDGKRLIPQAHPRAKGPEKLPDLVTFLAEDPVFQQLEKLKSDYRSELHAALEAAAEPVRSKYLPQISNVKSQLSAKLKAARKTGAADLAEDVEPEKVTKSGNFSESTSTVSTPEPLNTTETGHDGAPEEVTKSGNFLELSPIKKVTKSGNFQPPINIKEKRKGNGDKKSPRGRRASKEGVVVGRSVEKAPDQTDLPTRIKDAILETGIPGRLADTPSPALCKEIARRLNGIPNPIEALQARIAARADSITGLGLLKDLATDAAAAYRTSPPPAANDLDRRAKDAAEWQDRRAIETARAILANPNSDARDRELAREVLEAQPA